MRCLVLGGTGFIGRAVVAELVRRGHRVAVLHRGVTPWEPIPGVEYVRGDRTRLGELRDRLLALRPDAVVDAAPRGPDSAPVVALFRDRTRASVHISSQAVYRAWQVAWTGRGDPDPVPLTEDSPLRSRPGLGEDGYEPLLTEQAVRGQPGFPATVLRLPSVYGPGDRQRREWLVIRRLLDGRTVLPVGGGAAWLWTRAHVDDVARAVALAAASSRAAGEVYNVGEPRALTLAAWARAIARAMGREIRLVRIPDPLLPPHLQLFAYRPQHMVCSSERIRAHLGYREGRPPEESLAETVRWHLAHPPPGGGPAPDYAAEDAALARARELGLAVEEPGE